MMRAKDLVLDSSVLVEVTVHGHGGVLGELGSALLQGGAVDDVDEPFDQVLQERRFIFRRGREDRDGEDAGTNLLDVLDATDGASQVDQALRLLVGGHALDLDEPVRGVFTRAALFDGNLAEYFTLETQVNHFFPNMGGNEL